MKKYNEARLHFSHKQSVDDLVAQNYDGFTRDSLASYLAKKYGSVYLYGGDPFSEINLLESVVYKIRREGTRIRVETNGTYVRKHFNDENGQVKKILLNTDEVILRVDNTNEKHKDYQCVNNYCTVELQHCYDVFLRLYLKRCKYSLKSVISQNNIEDYRLAKEFANFKHLTKVVFERETRKSTTVSASVFTEFVDGMKASYPDIEFEVVDAEESVYYTGDGYAHINGNRIGYYSESGLKLPSKKLGTYRVVVNRNKMKQVLRKIRSKSTVFMDVEAVSTPYKHMKSYTRIKELPVLWTLVKIDNSMQIAERKIGFMREYQKRVDFQKLFIDYILENKIECIVVSGGDLERNFFKECLVSTRRKLSNTEFRKLLLILDNFVDIQEVIKAEAFKIQDNKQKVNLPLRSDNLLEMFSQHFSEIVDNKGRTNEKDSRQVSNRLDEILFSGSYNQDEVKTKMEEIGDYCFDDVYQDITVYRFYEMWDKYFARRNSPKNERKKMR